MEAFLEEYKHLRIQMEDIKSATCNFDNSNIIGQGGFGKVYQGLLSHSKGQSMVAFKRLDRRYGQGDPEFLKEILMLSRYTHENLISLLGFCDEDGEKILVYEHASHGSLDRHLSSTTLTWRQRLKICLATAKGLSYLHDPKKTQQRVLHRDIKSSNILLDEDWNPKVSDMGLSKIGPANQQHTFLATNVAGTFGYIDPAYSEKSILTKESDVYSFGVVLFEVLCGRLCYEIHDGHLQSLVRMWKKAYKQKKLDDIILKDLRQHMDPDSLKTYSDIAYRCLQKSREERPEMSHVVEKLEITLGFQEIFEKPLVDNEEKIKTVVLSEGIYVKQDRTSLCIPPPMLPHALRTPGTKLNLFKLDSRFILDITIVDGTIMAPRTVFTKIWRMKNNGSVIWPCASQLQWIGGDRLSNSLCVDLKIPPDGLRVDKELDIAVDFSAPQIPGRYISFWRMASPSGQKFGQRVWVLIEVTLKDLGETSNNLNLPPVK